MVEEACSVYKSVADFVEGPLVDLSKCCLHCSRLVHLIFMSMDVSCNSGDLSI